MIFPTYIPLSKCLYPASQALGKGALRSFSSSKSIDLSIYLVTNRLCASNEDVFVNKVIRAVQGGVTCVQIRDREEDLRACIETTYKLKKLLTPFNIPLIVNDRVDVALATHADGVHLGQNDFPYKEARKLLGPRAIIGLSVDRWEDVVEAEELDVDYLGVSQLFPSERTKPDCESPWGLEGLRKIREFSRHRLVVIGGVHLDNLTEVFSELHIGNKQDGVAMVGDLWRSEDPSVIARKVQKVFLNHCSTEREEYE